MSSRKSRPLITFCLIGMSHIAFGASAADHPTQKSYRQPTALAVIGETVYTANRLTGTISCIGTETGTVTGEYTVASQIADMAATPAKSLLVVDNALGQLLAVTFTSVDPIATKMADVPKDISSIAVVAEQQQIYLSSRWSHKVWSIQLDESFSKVERTVQIDVPFPPGELLALESRQLLLAADAFSNKVAVIDMENHYLLRVRTVTGHNLRGLAYDKSKHIVHIAHQRLGGYARADFEELHWGRLMTNAVQIVPLDDVVSGPTIRITGGWVDAQGGIGRATADPSEVVVADDGASAVAFSGVGEVVLTRHGNQTRIVVGRGCAAMAFDDRHLYVANRFDDSISIIDLESREVTKTVSLGPIRSLTSVERGEQLFFDAGLSHEGWISCHSCHSDGHTSGLVVDTLGDGDYGAAKLVPSLLGARDTGPWSWTGSMKSLEAQIEKSVMTTMHGSVLNPQQLADLTAYVNSLAPPPAPGITAPQLVVKGERLFNSLGCINCHAGEALTSSDTFDVDLVDERDRRSFNPPSLRGLAHRKRFFHDGRAKSVHEVFTKYGHGLEMQLSKPEIDALAHYLLSQ